MKKKIAVERETRNFWKAPRQGFIRVTLKTQDNEEKTVNFSDYESFYKVFTPQRVEILSLLAKEKVKSINQLSKILNRDSKNVRNDISVLEATGLIRLREDRNRKVPELRAKEMSVSIRFGEIRPLSPKRELSRERLEYGRQMIRQKYLSVNPIVASEVNSVGRS